MGGEWARWAAGAAGGAAGHPLLGWALAGALALWALRRWLTCPEVYGRHKFKRGRRDPGSPRRAKLDRIRATAGHFPPPYPDGWYKIAESSEVPKGKVFTESALGREFVVFRGEDGRAGVLDAFCPHLGTHLGHGGQVVGNNIQCPYHLWEFDKDGENKNIPYCRRDMSSSRRVNLKRYTTLESEALGAIFFWFSADDCEPRYEIHPPLRAVEKEIQQGRMRHIYSDRWDDMLMHVFEPSQNSADYFHFQTVHQYLPMPFNLRLVKADHQITTTYGKEGTDVPANCLYIHEQVKSLRLFGLDVFTFPSFVARSIDTRVLMQGPNNILFEVDTIFGRLRAHFALLPLEPFCQKGTMTMYADKSVPWIVGRMLHWWIKETAAQDLEVWENKIHVAPRNLVNGDGPFAQYGRWLKQFYTSKSVSWESISQSNSLDW